MFDIGPVYSGERFRASGPSCYVKVIYVMGKALTGGLSCLATGLIKEKDRIPVFISVLIVIQS